MIKLNNFAVGETPMFASILSEMEGLDDVLFEVWEPADSTAFCKEHFPPFRWDGEAEGEEPDPEATLEVDEPEYLGTGVHMLQNRQTA